MRTIALFDLDGTITRADTMLEFLAFAKGKWKARLLLASVLPLWGMAKLKLVDPAAPKRALMRRAFAGEPVAAMEHLAEQFVAEHMPQLLRPGAMECIQQHLRNGVEVVIVTASCSLWTRPWCRQNGLRLIATELEASEGTFTGRLSTPNCKGAEKVRRIKAELGDPGTMDVHAYGDTPSDRPMLALARIAHYKPFRDQMPNIPANGRTAAFPRAFLTLAALLALCFFLACRMAWYDTPASALVGSYHRASSRFLPVDSLPQTMELRADGTMDLLSAAGDTMYTGAWTWDEKERILRTMAPRWDRQIRMRSTLTGPRLCMRVSPIPFRIDEEEHDEEVDWIKASPSIASLTP